MATEAIVQHLVKLQLAVAAVLHRIQLAEMADQVAAQVTVAEAARMLAAQVLVDKVSVVATLLQEETTGLVQVAAEPAV